MQADKSLGQKLASRLNVRPSIWSWCYEMCWVEREMEQFRSTHQLFSSIKIMVLVSLKKLVMFVYLIETVLFCWSFSKLDVCLKLIKVLTTFVLAEWYCFWVDSMLRTRGKISSWFNWMASVISTMQLFKHMKGLVMVRCAGLAGFYYCIISFYTSIYYIIY